MSRTTQSSNKYGVHVAIVKSNASWNWETVSHDEFTMPGEISLYY